MISSTQEPGTATTGPTDASPTARSDVFSLATMPVATWLTQLMVAQKVAEAVCRQSNLTAEFVGSGAMPTADRDSSIVSTDTARMFQDLRECRDQRARVTAALAAQRRDNHNTTLPAFVTSSRRLRAALAK
jgi:hypothetical protein